MGNVLDGIFGGASDPEPLQLQDDPQPITPDANSIARRRRTAERRRRAISSLRIDDTDTGTGLSLRNSG